MLKKNLPNFVTTLNITCGVLSIFFTFDGQVLFAAWLVVVAALFDFLDGLIARLLNAYSKFGKELDSLADIISFGVAPSIILYSILRSEVSCNLEQNLCIRQVIILYSPILIVICSALRLAKYNINTNQQKTFTGLPTPASALLIASVVMLKSDTSFYLPLGISLNYQFFYILIIVVSYLLVSNIAMFSLKVRNLDFKENKIQFVFLFLSAIIIIYAKELSLFFIIILYILLSIGTHLYTKIKLK